MLWVLKKDEHPLDMFKLLDKKSQYDAQAFYLCEPMLIVTIGPDKDFF